MLMVSVIFLTLDFSSTFQYDFDVWEIMQLLQRIPAHQFYHRAMGEINYDRKIVFRSKSNGGVNKEIENLRKHFFHELTRLHKNTCTTNGHQFIIFDQSCLKFETY